MDRVYRNHTNQQALWAGGRTKDMQKVQAGMKRAALALMVLAFGACAWAQSANGKIEGTVKDKSGALIVKAEVSVVEDGTGQERTATSGKDGSFALNDIAPATYTVTVISPGFSTYVQQHVTVETNQNVRLNVTLAVGSQTEQVVVNTDAPSTINTDTSSKGEVITERQVQELPLNGRDYTDLLTLVPGVFVRPSSTDQGQGVSANGTRTDSTNVNLDGASIRTERQGGTGFTSSVDSIKEFKVLTSTYSAEYGRVAGAQVNVVTKSGTNKVRGTLFEYFRNDALDAKNFLSNPAISAAEGLHRSQFGGTVGGPIVKNKLFYFLSYEGIRQVRGEFQQFLAPNPDWLGRGASHTIGDFRNIGIGGSLVTGDQTGCPTTLYPSSSKAQPAIPLNCPQQIGYRNTSTWMQFSTPNVINPSLLDPIALKILPYIPAANLPGTDNYLANGKALDTEDTYLGKFDWQMGPRNHAYLRYAMHSGFPVEPLFTGSDHYEQWPRTGNTRVHSAAFDITTILSPKLVNEVILGYQLTSSGSAVVDNQYNYGQLFGIPLPSFDPRYNGFPAINIDGLPIAGNEANDPFGYRTKTLQFSDSVTIQTLRHTIKFGGVAYQSNYHEADLSYLRGRFRFRGEWSDPTKDHGPEWFSIADFLMGALDSTQIQTSILYAAMNNWTYSGFIQDDWRVVPRLTINAGLRYDFSNPYREAQDRFVNFNRVTGNLDTACQNGVRCSILEPDTHDIQPRLGFAYLPFNNQRTVIRGGGGIFFTQETLNVARQQLVDNPPLVNRQQFSRASSDRSQLTFANPFNATLGRAQLEYGLNPAAVTPVVYQYNLTVEREVVKDLVAEVGYVGSSSKHLGRRFNINQGIPTGLSSSGSITYVYPYPAYGTNSLQYQEEEANGNFNSLQASARRRTRGGLTFLASYTFSRGIDDGSNTNNSTAGTQKFAQDIRNLRAERGLADYHRAHQFRAAVNYALPFGPGHRFGGGKGSVGAAITSGWTLNGIVTHLSGRPFTPQYLTPDISSQRPNIVGDPRQPGMIAANPTCVGPKTIDTHAGLGFNPCAFVTPVPTAANGYSPFGNAGRNILIGESFNDTDVGLTRQFSVTDRYKVFFRGEVFNIFNHPNLDLPVYYLDQSNVGQFTATVPVGNSNASGPNREVQLALRLSF